MFPKPQWHEPPQYVHPFVVHPRRPVNRRSALPRSGERVRTEINPNFSCDQLDRVDWGRTNRDTIAKGEQ